MFERGESDVMKVKTYKKLIYRMMKEINNEEDVKKIFNYIHRFFINRVGK